jgi:hypothetical protein
LNIETIIAGDTLDFTVSVPEYPATDGWTLKYRLTPRFTTPAQLPVVLTASMNADGQQYDIQASPATTAAFVPGAYAWARWVEKAGARQTLNESGSLLVKADPSATAQGYDGRSQAAKAVDDIKAAMATFTASNGTIKSYSIGNRQVTYRDKAEMLTDLDFWQRQLMAENEAVAMAGGLGNPRNVGIRFHRL